MPKILTAPVQILSIELHSYSILNQSACGDVGGTVADDAQPTPPLALIALAPQPFVRRPLGGPKRAATRAAFPLTVAATVHCIFAIDSIFSESVAQMDSA